MISWWYGPVIVTVVPHVPTLHCDSSYVLLIHALRRTWVTFVRLIYGYVYVPACHAHTTTLSTPSRTHPTGDTFTTTSSPHCLHDHRYRLTFRYRYHHSYRYRLRLPRLRYRVLHTDSPGFDSTLLQIHAFTHSPLFVTLWVRLQFCRWIPSRLFLFWTHLPLRLRFSIPIPGVVDLTTDHLTPYYRFHSSRSFPTCLEHTPLPI